MERKKKSSLPSLNCINSVADVLHHARKDVRTSIYSTMVYTYPAYLIGMLEVAVSLIGMIKLGKRCLPNSTIESGGEDD